jgi:hypothetical protein
MLHNDVHHMIQKKKSWEMPKNLILLHDNTSHIQEGDTANNGL